MKKRNLINSISKDAQILANANQLKYVLFKNKLTGEFDYCSLPEWDLVFNYIKNIIRIKTITPIEFVDYNNVVISAHQKLEKHSDLFKDFEIIEFKPNQFTYKLIRK